MRRRISGFPLRLAAAALAIAGFASPAAAAFDPGCPPGGCVFDPLDGPFGPGLYDFDFTVPPDGRRYRWTIDYTSADPGAGLSLDGPNQVEAFYTTRAGGGFVDSYSLDVPYLFDVAETPGRTTIIVQAPREFDFCSLAVPDGTTCAATIRVWGNGTSLTATGTSPITATFSETAIPEPATWALLLAGFGLVGTGLRRGRRTRTQPLEIAA